MNIYELVRLISEDDPFIVVTSVGDKIECHSNIPNEETIEILQMILDSMKGTSNLTYYNPN